ncbi:MAG: type II secretion system F family protein [Actinomycetota bacterium]
MIVDGVLAIMFATGVAMMVAGRRKPTLAERVDALRPLPMRPPPPPSVFRFPALEAAIRPAMESVGEALARLAHLDTERIERDLALAGRDETVQLFVATRLVAVGLALLLIPAARGLGLVRLPVWLGPVFAVGAWVGPDYFIRAEARARKVVLEGGLAVACLDIALRVAGGAGISEGVRTAAQAQGAFGKELRAALARAATQHLGPADALEDLAGRTGLEEAQELATTLRAGEHGAPVADTVMAQAAAIGERHSRDAKVAGQRAEVLMVVVQAGLVFPGVALLLIYPAASSLLRIAHG